MMKISTTVFSVLIFFNMFAIAEQVIDNKEGDSSFANCHSLNGAYRVPNSFDAQNFWLAGYEQEFFANGHTKQEIIFVDIQQVKDKKLRVTLKGEEHKPLLTYIYDYPYICEKGWITYKSHVKGSGDGSSVVSTNTETRMKKMDDGSLLVIGKTTTVIKKWLFARKQEVVERQYKFKNK